jgi:hypothetical protein
MLELEHAREMIQLHIAALESFDELQVRHICELLRADYDKLPGAGKRDKIREVVLWANRRGRLDELIDDCCQIQPDFHWEDKALAAGIPDSVQRTSLEELGAILAAHFSLDDLKQLAFYLGIDFENVSGSHGLFGTTHDLSERGKQWLSSQGIDHIIKEFPT